MELKNSSRKTIISKDAKLVKSVWGKANGLMFTFKPKALIFKFDKPQKTNLHMFFVFYPIDVLFLNKQKKVVEIKENFKPFTTYNPSKEANYVVEVVAETVKKTKTTVGDTISF